MSRYNIIMKKHYFPDIIISILLCIAALYMLMTGTLRANNGQYTYGTYTCHLSNEHIKIVDVGAGNPVLKGSLFRLGSSEYLLFCPFDDDYDEVFLGKPKVSTVKVSFKDSTFSIDDISFKKVPAPEALEKRIKFRKPFGWKKTPEDYWGDTNIVSGQGFEKGNGYLTVSVFSFRGQDCCGNDISVEKFPDRTHIDGRNCYTGYLSEDDTEKAAKIAYIEDGDYVYCVRMSNSDNVITERQEKVFDSFLDSVHFRQDCLKR